MLSQFIIFVIFIICSSMIICFYIKENNKNKENFYNYFLDTSGNKYPESITKPSSLLVENQYPFINRKKFSSKNKYSEYWWKFQNTKNTSYEQVTNNFKHLKNTDISNAIPQEFSGIFYHNTKNKKSNIIYPNPPVPNIEGTVRIGYFNSFV